MSEAIIARAGKSGGQVDLSGINSNINTMWNSINNIQNLLGKTLINCTITNTEYYTCIKSGNYWIECVGGGGGGNGSSWTDRGGGGSGYINNGRIYLYEGNSIFVSIGEGGVLNSYGATTAFGTYLSANGGSAYRAGTGTSGGIGANNAVQAKGGLLYYDDSNERKVSISGIRRLYYGDGGNAGGNNATEGNSGCVIITYMD